MRVRTVALKIVEFCTSLGGNLLKKGRKEAKVGTTFRGILKVEERKKSWQLKRKLRNVRACVRVRVRESCV